MLLWTGCGSDSGRQPAVGEAFVGPVTLNIRRELGPRQPTVATVRQGERLEILQKYRVFVKVRTAGGVEGWTDGRLLFGPEKAEDLRWLAEQAALLPSQGTAKLYEKLNLHIAPNRKAPTFLQLREGDQVEVVAHSLTPRVPYNPDEPDTEVPPSTPMDDWSLVRTVNGRAGWALFRMLTMAIPDEVAQYAEGHRITSYFPLGEVRDGGQIKKNWLWTTIAKGLEPYEFDSFRVFMWSRRHHRYETAYIERNLKGFYPVQVEAAGSRDQSAPPRFSLIVEGKDGRKYRRTYAFQGYRVRLVAKELWNAPAPQFQRPAPEEPQQIGKEQKSFITRLSDRLRGLWRRRTDHPAQP